MSSQFWNTLLFVTAGILLVRWFFAPKGADRASLASRADLSGQLFKAPVSVLETRLLNKEVDFDDKSVDRDHANVQLSTALCDYEFSTGGGILSRMAFKKYLGKQSAPLATIYPRGDVEREMGCFLIALDNKTPYAYRHVGTERDANGMQQVTFEAQTADWTIRKTYAVNDHDYALKLTCTFKPRSTSVAALQPRIFLASPFVADLTGGDTIDGFTSDLDKTSINKVATAQEGDFGWKLPSVFGAGDKYFLHALYAADNADFIQRAYYKRAGVGDLSCILEGSSLTGPTEVSLSFYMGPKSLAALNAVDTRLPGVLSFGWLSSICNLLIKLLEWLYSLFGNFGWAIFLLAFLVKLALLPLSLYAGWRTSAYKAFERKCGSEIASINARYKNDVIKREEELRQLHAEHGVSRSWQLIGILPALPRLPIIFALYRMLGNYIGLYHAPFIGWITDLSLRDPYYVLPAIFAVFIIIKTNQTAKFTDLRARLLSYALPLLTVGIIASFPAGLVLFVAADSIATVGEEWLVKLLF